MAMVDAVFSPYDWPALFACILLNSIHVIY